MKKTEILKLNNICMSQNLLKPAILLIFVCIFITCIDPFTTDLKKFESLLVIDALVTDENSSYTVRLSRTNKTQFSEISMLTGALVSILDDTGVSAFLHEAGNGVYKTDSLQFLGKPGRSYKINIATTDGNEYESEFSFMYPVDQIDRIYFSKDQEIQSNGGETVEGIRIYLDSESNDEGRFYRWTYDEWWKIVVPDPKKFIYLNDSTIFEVDQVKQICWGNKKSDDIIIQSTDIGGNNRIVKKPILFIDSEKTPRLLIKYCIDIKQLSVSEKEYEFWNHLKQINESGGDIFEKQPFPVFSNIHNINDPEETVLGFFQVSAVSHKRIYISADDIASMNLPKYIYNCNRTVLGPIDFPPPITGGGITFDKIYKMYVGPVYAFVEPVYNSQHELLRLAFSKIDCTDCTLNGTLEKPDFWVE